MNRVRGAIADVVDTALDAGAAQWLWRALVLAGAVLLATGGALIATSLLGSPQPGLTELPRAATETPVQTSSPSPSGSPGGEVAGSTPLVANFDAFPTNSEIEGWSLADGASLTTAAQPTAVDRSARLDKGTACHELAVDLAALEVTFMVDRPSDGGVTELRLALRDGATHHLRILAGEALVGPGSEPVALESRAWYRWRLEASDEGVRSGLFAADESLLAEGVTDPAPDARATEFCMTAAAPTRLYLSEVTVGTP